MSNFFFAYSFKIDSNTSPVCLSVRHHNPQANPAKSSKHLLILVFEIYIIFFWFQQAIHIDTSFAIIHMQTISLVRQAQISRS